jgi:hypothetical protein
LFDFSNLPNAEIINSLCKAATNLAIDIYDAVIAIASKKRFRNIAT